MPRAICFRRRTLFKMYQVEVLAVCNWYGSHFPRDAGLFRGLSAWSPILPFDKSSPGNLRTAPENSKVRVGGDSGATRISCYRGAQCKPSFVPQPTQAEPRGPCHTRAVPHEAHISALFRVALHSVHECFRLPPESVLSIGAKQTGQLDCSCRLLVGAVTASVSTGDRRIRPAASALLSFFLLRLSLLVINIDYCLTGHASRLSIWASAEFWSSRRRSFPLTFLRPKQPASLIFGFREEWPVTHPERRSVRSGNRFVCRSQLPSRPKPISGRGKRVEAQIRQGRFDSRSQTNA
jgi:hypothetical protein